MDRVFNLHEFYVEQTTEEGRGKIIKGARPLIERLAALNVKTVFSETVLIFGDEFLTFEFGVSWDKMRKLYISL